MIQIPVPSVTRKLVSEFRPQVFPPSARFYFDGIYFSEDTSPMKCRPQPAHHHHQSDGIHGNVPLCGAQGAGSCSAAAPAAERQRSK